MKKVMVGFVALGAIALQAHPVLAAGDGAPRSGDSANAATSPPSTSLSPDGGDLATKMQAEASRRASEPVRACLNGSDADCVQVTPPDLGAAERPAGSGAPVVTATSADAFGLPVPQADQATSWSPLCTGTGTDGYRVQPILAYDANGSGPTTGKLDQIQSAIANADVAYSDSAQKTGGYRRVRFATTGGSAGCQLSIVTAPVTSGLTSFDALQQQLIDSGYARFSTTDNNGIKYLIWTEGDLEPSTPTACGVGLRYGDNVAGSLDNANIWTSFAAVKDPCWDLASGGSVPAHELMHMLGAVQDSAPHAANSGHCNDEYDLMCYGPGMSVYCPDSMQNALFDCNNDDYFNTNPAPGSYLCTHWDTARSPYLDGWDAGLAPIGPVSSLTATGLSNGISISWTPPPGCPGPSFYGLQVSGMDLIALDSGTTSAFVPAAPGHYSVAVGAWRDSGGPFSYVDVHVPAPNVDVNVPPAPNQHPSGGIVLSATQGHSYGLLAYAFDPETNAPTRVRVTVEGVSSKEYDWNYDWADMPRFTGLNHHESFVFLAQLPSGNRNVCFDAQDPQDGSWTNIGCRGVSVK